MLKLVVPMESLCQRESLKKFSSLDSVFRDLLLQLFQSQQLHLHMSTLGQKTKLINSLMNIISFNKIILISLILNLIQLLIMPQVSIWMIQNLSTSIEINTLKKMIRLVNKNKLNKSNNLKNLNNLQKLSNHKSHKNGLKIMIMMIITEEINQVILKFMIMANIIETTTKWTCNINNQIIRMSFLRQIMKQPHVQIFQV